MTPGTSEVTVLVASCDAYADLWAPFFALFRRNWSDCPWRVVLMTNCKRFSGADVECLPVGHRGSWSSEIRAVLEQIESRYVLLMLDDFFLRQPVQQATIASCVDCLRSLDGVMLRLVKRPGPDTELPGDSAIGAIAPYAPYRVSAQAAIWRRDVLQALLVDGESIWEFECVGSGRAAVLPGFYGVWSSVLPYRHHVVERGKWFPWEAYRFGRMRIGCDFSRREIMSFRTSVVWCARKLYGLAYNSVPWRWRRAVRLFIKKGRQ